MSSPLDCYHSQPRIPFCAGPKLFFDGAGWAFNFNLGVARYLLERFDLSSCPLYGISAGNFACLCILFKIDPMDMLQEHFEGILRDMSSRPMFGFCDNLEPVAKFLRSWLPHNAHELASGRLHVAISSWPSLGMRFISQFKNNEELIDAIVASCSFPGFVAKPRVSCHDGWSGCWYDAGLQNMVTPIDTRMDLPVRAFDVPPCTSWVTHHAPCYCGPPSVAPLSPTGDAVHAGRFPHLRISEALKFMFY